MCRFTKITWRRSSILRTNLDCEFDECRVGRDFDLLFDQRDGIGNGLIFNVETRCDLRGAFAFAEKGHDVSLSRAEWAQNITCQVQAGERQGLRHRLPEKDR